MTEETNTAIVANTNDLVVQKEMRFRFKKDKLGSQRATVELTLPVPSVKGIVSILEKGGKSLDMLVEVVADTMRSYAVGIVGDKEDISQENFPFDQFTWDYLANMPRAERKTIDEAIWKGFVEDYIAVMPGVTNKTVDAVTAATTVYLKKFSIVKTNKGVLGKLKEQLGLYMEHSKKAEEYAEILELLLGKVEAYLKADDVELLIANL